MNEPLPDPAEQNIDRLLSEAYRPENIDTGFAKQTLAQLQKLAAERRQPKTPWQQMAWLYLANAAAVVLLIVTPSLFWHFFLRPAEEEREKALRAARPAAPAGDPLTARPRPAPPNLPLLESGTRADTAAGQTKRLRLPDDSIVSLNHDTKVRLDADRRLDLLTGEIFLEIAPAESPFVILTEKRRVTALGTRLALRTAEAGTRVLVTQGQVQVSDVEGIVHAGEVVEPDADRPAPAPRVSHDLDWARDLLAGDPLVPPGDFRGGALVARTADGEEMRLSLRRFHIDVHIEDGFARTTIDQTYFNHTFGRIEGMFHFPLPADASLSRLAMYVNGTLMEGGMVEREHGRAVFESIVRSMKDPALLEWVDGTTFKMRVFPLEPRQEKRIVLSYTQKLPALYGRTTYRFPSGHSLDEVGAWSFAACVKGGASVVARCPSHKVTERKDGDDLLLSAEAKRVKLERDVVLELKDPAYTGGEQVRFAAADYRGLRFFAVRFRPDLPPREGPRPRRDWVILFESSADRDPLLARTQIEIVRTLLDNAEAEDTFLVLTANTRVNGPTEPQSVTKDAIERAVAKLGRAHLIGGFDLGKALAEATSRAHGLENPHIVHVGSGLPTLGERREDELLKNLPEEGRYIGIGVGKRWNRSLMKRAADKTGGLFAQINPDEPVGWRAFDLLAMLNTPRLLGARVSAAEGGLRFHSDAGLVAHGEEMCAVARFDPNHQRDPGTVIVEGTVEGKPYRREVAVRDVSGDAGYLPRTWGRLEIDHLVAESPRGNKEGIIRLSKELYVMSPFTSLLVLENEAMYTQYNVDRGRKDHWAMYPCPEKIPVFFEPPVGDPQPLQGGQPPAPPARPSVEQVLTTVLARPWPADRSRDLSERDEWEERHTRTLDEGTGIRLFDHPSGKLIRPRFFNQADAESRDFALDILDGYRGLQNRSGGFGREVWEIAMSPEPTALASGTPKGPPIDMPPRVPPPPLPDPFGIEPVVTNPRERRIVSVTKHLRSMQQKVMRAGELEGPDRLPALEPLSGEMIVRTSAPELMYRRPSLQLGRAILSDLTLFAPGLQTSQADIHAVIEAEAALSNPPAPGRIADAARKLIDRARSAGWHKVPVPGEKGRDGFTVLCDGAGRYRYERAVTLGLREIVVCDGTTLLHLYPEIGLAARRSVSRFHRAEFRSLVPWALPAAEELALDADLDTLGDDVVVLTPHRGKHVLHLVFGKDGRLVEWRRVEKDGGKVVESRTCETPAQAKEPDLKPDLRELIVLPMPWRSHRHLAERSQKLVEMPIRTLDEDDALRVIASAFAEQRSDLARLIKDRYFARQDHRRGLFVLLAAGTPPDDPQEERWLEKEFDRLGPLGEHLAKHSRFGRLKEAKKDSQEEPPFNFVNNLRYLDMLLEASSGRLAITFKGETRMMAAVRSCDHPMVQWAIVEAYAERSDPSRGDVQAPGPQHVEVLDELSKALRDIPALGYATRYERARILALIGRRDESRRAFGELYAETQSAGALPPIDAAFRDALGVEGWREFMTAAAERWLNANRPAAVIALAEQCHHLGHADLGADLLARAVARGDAEKRERTAIIATASLLRLGRPAEAEKLLRPLLEAPAPATNPTLWRLAASAAEALNRPTTATAHLEKSLDLRWNQQPRQVRPDLARRDYDLLLSHYERVLRASADLEREPPAGLSAKVLRAIERWRVLDPTGPAAEKGYPLLTRLDERDWAWDYLTTSLSGREATAETWREKATEVHTLRDPILASRCLAEACALEPTNAALLLEYARMLRLAGEPDASRALLRRLVREPWPPQYRAAQTTARELLGEP